MYTDGLNLHHAASNHKERVGMCHDDTRHEEVEETPPPKSGQEVEVVHKSLDCVLIHLSHCR